MKSLKVGRPPFIHPRRGAQHGEGSRMHRLGPRPSQPFVASRDSEGRSSSVTISVKHRGTKIG